MAFPTGPPRVRTRPEGAENALKNRSTNDWFQHDASEKPINSRTSNGSDVPNRCRTLEAKATRDRICGRDELWYKHDDNAHYTLPVAPDRGSQNARQVKEKFVSAASGSMAWYKHEDNVADEVHLCRLNGTEAKEIKHKYQDNGKAPNWYEHHPELCEDTIQHQRLTSKEARENCDRDRGNAGAWFEHGTSTDAGCPVPAYRVTSKEGEDIAGKLSTESDSWYVHDETVAAGKPDARRPPSKQHQSTGTWQVFGQPADEQIAQSKMPNRRVNLNPTAAAFAVKSRTGSVGAVLDSTSGGSNLEATETIHPRTVKPEAQATFEKSRGCMDEFLQGYLAPPNHHTTHKSRPASGMEKYSGCAMEQALKGGMPCSGRGHFARAVKPEAEMNATRNQGSMKQLMTDNVPAATRNDVHYRLKSEAAVEIAKKYHGSVGQLLC